MLMNMRLPGEILHPSGSLISKILLLMNPELRSNKKDDNIGISIASMYERLHWIKA